MKLVEFEEILKDLVSDVTMEKRSDEWWLEQDDLDIRAVSQRLIERGIRLITMTALPIGETECRVIYHWDWEGRMLNVKIVSRNGRVPSILDICPVADWIEREIRDYFGIEFDGREMPPLLLRANDFPGIFRWDFKWKHEQGEDA